MTIVIIGAGFSGTLTAVHLLRSRAAGRRRVVLVNRSGAMARGVAYGTRSEQHVLNVPAARMSAFDDDPDSFVRFARKRDLTIEGGTFVRRDLYGEYLEWLLRNAAERATHGTLERIVGEVSLIAPSREGAAAWVEFPDRPPIRANRVVLAVGNYPPQDPNLRADVHDPGFWKSRRYVRDPWRAEAFSEIDQLDQDAPMLCIGTGLTMIDVVLERMQRGKQRQFVAVSRRGLVPQPHRAPALPPHHIDLPAALLDAAAPATARGYCRTVRRHIREAQAKGVDWRDVMAALRPITATLWQSLSLDERRRWLRHVRPFWEVHRHRVSPQPYEAFSRLLQEGRVRTLAGRLIAFREEPHGVVVSIRLRGTNEIHELTVASVVNCTGPAGDTLRLDDPLFASLRAQGLLQPDPLGLGIETSPDGAALGRDGQPVPTLYYVGPFLRARDWEATAVPELRRYAQQLAEHLIASFISERHASASSPIPFIG